MGTLPTPFLSAYGLSLASINNPGVFAGNIDVSGASHPIFDGVSTLYQNGAQSIEGTGVVFSHLGFGSFAVAQSPTAFVPEPAILLLVGSSAVALGMRRHRESRQPSGGP